MGEREAEVLEDTHNKKDIFRFVIGISVQLLQPRRFSALSLVQQVQCRHQVNIPICIPQQILQERIELIANKHFRS